MYLSRLTLNTRNREMIRAVDNLYHMHQLLWTGFPSADQGGPGRVMFRLELPDGGRPYTALVQSDKEPRWTALDSMGCLMRPAEWKPLSLAVPPGQRLRFRLRANPTVRRIWDRETFDSESGKPPSGTRVGIYDEQQQRLWLQRKMAEGGCALLDYRVLKQGVLLSRKPEAQGSIRHVCVDFDGCLAVADPEALLRAVATGIGSGKAFGFGLLSLARAGAI